MSIQNSHPKKQDLVTVLPRCSILWMTAQPQVDARARGGDRGTHPLDLDGGWALGLQS